MPKRTWDHEYAEAVVEYLREHGPSDTLAMKMAGLEIPDGLMHRMYQRGIIRRTRRSPYVRGVSRVVWGLKRWST